MKKQLFLLSITLFILSCQTLCPCAKKQLSTSTTSQLSPLSKWKSQYIMHEISADEYIDLLEGEISRLKQNKQ